MKKKKIKWSWVLKLKKNIVVNPNVNLKSLKQIVEDETR